MTRLVANAALAAVFLAMAGFAAAPSRAAEGTFQCSSSGGADFCICKGTENCRTMRKSGACSTALDCTVKNDVTICTCTAALTAGGSARTKPPTKLSPK